MSEAEVMVKVRSEKRRAKDCRLQEFQCEAGDQE